MYMCNEMCVYGFRVMFSSQVRIASIMATPLYVLGTMTPFEVNHFPFFLNCSLFKVKAHYGGQRMLSQILFFETMQLSTSTKPILKEVFINYTKNRIVQQPTNNVIIKGLFIFINIKLLKSIFVIVYGEHKLFGQHIFYCHPSFITKHGLCSKILIH